MSELGKSFPLNSSKISSGLDTKVDFGNTSFPAPLAKISNEIEKAKEVGGEVEVIEGTLANPFPIEVANELATSPDVEGRNVQAILYIPFNKLWFPAAILPTDGVFIQAGFAGQTSINEVMGLVNIIYLFKDPDTGEPLSELTMFSYKYYIISMSSSPKTVQDMSPFINPEEMNTVTILTRFNPVEGEDSGE